MQNGTDVAWKDNQSSGHASQQFVRILLRPLGRNCRDHGLVGDWNYRETRTSLKWWRYKTEMQLTTLDGVELLVGSECKKLSNNAQFTSKTEEVA
jgi:hypothetical protein